MRPLNYFDGNTALGHYKVAQTSGTVTVMAAGEDIAAVRWPDTSALFVLQKLRIGLTIVTAVTAAIQLTFKATIVRGFTVDYTTARTAAAMSAKPKTGAMRSGVMASSRMAGVGPQICTTLTMSGETFTADADAFAMASCPTLLPTNSTGTAVLLAVGTAIPMTTLYEWTGLGEHPVTLGFQEGIVVSPVVDQFATGTWKYYVEWTWGEVAATAF